MRYHLLANATSLALGTIGLGQSLPMPAQFVDFVGPSLRVNSPGAFGDIDGDGDADLVQVTRPAGAAFGPGTLAVIRSAGGTFAPAVNVPTCFAASAIVLGDLDNDGDLDAVVTGDGTTPSTWVHANDGTGGFGSPPVALVNPDYVSAFRVLDLDGDGLRDIWLLSGAGEGFVRRGLGGLTFGPPLLLPPATLTWEPFDDDGDGDGDLHEALGGVLRTWRNLGALGFAPPIVRCSLSPDVYYVRFADLNGDGRADALTTGTTATGTTVAQVAFGGPGGVLAPGSVQVLASVMAGDRPEFLDLDGDGDRDVTIGQSSLNALLLWARNDGTGTFFDVQWHRHHTSLGPTRPIVGDLDADGRDDVVFGTVIHRSLGNRLAGARELQLPISTVLTPQLELGDFDLAGSLDAICGMGDNGLALVRDFATSPQSTVLTVGAPVTRIALGDFDRDANLDVLAVTANFARLLRGNGAGALVPQPPMPLSVIAREAAAADINGDGRLDLLVASSVVGVGSRIDVLLGDGSGTFPTSVTTTLCGAGCTVSSLQVADFDRDGRLDLVVTLVQWPSPQRIVLLGVGDGTFTPLPAQTGAPTPTAIGDFDGDGILDLVSAGFQGVALEAGLGNGSFGAPTTTWLIGPTGTSFSGALASGEIDGDGRLDLATAAGALLRNQGTGFLPSYCSILHADDVAIADVDGDLQNDIVLLHGQGRLSVLCNSTSTSGGGSVVGTGCPGNGGFVPRLAPRGLAQPGGTLTFDVDQALGGSFAWLIVGPTPLTVPMGAGCRLYVDFQGAVLVGLPLVGPAVAGAGRGTFSLPIPPGLSPLTLAVEAIVLDFASPFAFAGSNGAVVTIQ